MIIIAAHYEKVGYFVRLLPPSWIQCGAFDRPRLFPHHFALSWDPETQMHGSGVGERCTAHRWHRCAASYWAPRRGQPHRGAAGRRGPYWRRRARECGQPDENSRFTGSSLGTYQLQLTSSASDEPHSAKLDKISRVIGIPDIPRVMDPPIRHRLEPRQSCGSFTFFLFFPSLFILCLLFLKCKLLVLTLLFHSEVPSDSPH